MKISKSFSRLAGPKGRVFYRRTQNVVVPIRLDRLTATLSSAPGNGGLSYSLVLDGKTIAQGSASADAPLVAELGLRLRRGERTFTFTAEGFEPNQVVDGTVEIEFGFF
jgi:hypothetical protein